MLYWKGEVGVGIGFVFQGEVPPLFIVGLETMAHHGVAQNHAVLKLFRSDGAPLRTVAFSGVLARFGVAAEVGMALRPEPVEGAAHVSLFLGVHIEEGEVHGGSALVTAATGNVAAVKQHILDEIRIEVGLHQCVGEVGTPAHEVVNGHLRTVGVVDFQTVALLFQLVTDGAEAVGSLAREQCGGLQVSIDTAANEVVGAVVADFKENIRHYIGNHYKVAGIIGGNHLFRSRVHSFV